MTMGGTGFDAVIVGGGLSGLSLAAAMATGGWRDRSVLVVDDSASHQVASCWGFWSAGGGPLDAAVSRTYQRVQISAGGSSRIVPLGRYRYNMIRRADLVRFVKEIVAACPGFVIRQGHVEEIVDSPDAAGITVDGEMISASWAFDSVSHGASAGAPDALMAFSGWEIDCCEEVFEERTPVLFDFRTRRSAGVRFGYVLPDDRKRALVDLVEFVGRTGSPPSRQELDEALASYVTEFAGDREYQVIRRESAVLPLRCTPPARRGGRVLAIGAAAGLVRASTGYAVQRIQRDSAAIVDSLVRFGHPWRHSRSRYRHRLMDALLLDVLDRDPAQIELAFGRLFSANPPERVLRFLDEDSRIADDVRLAASLPWAPYLRALARRMAHLRA